MRYLPLLLLLASCQTWGWSDTADLMMPDELIIGHGKGQHTGSLLAHHDLPYSGDTEANSLALSWSLPSFKSDNGMSRETQRNLALLVDHMANEEGLVVEDPAEGDGESAVVAGPLQLNLREGVALPSKEVIFGVVGVIALLLALLRFKTKSSRRQW